MLNRELWGVSLKSRLKDALFSALGVLVLIGAAFWTCSIYKVAWSTSDKTVIALPLLGALIGFTGIFTGAFRRIGSILAFVEPGDEQDQTSIAAGVKLVSRRSSGKLAIIFGAYSLRERLITGLTAFFAILAAMGGQFWFFAVIGVSWSTVENSRLLSPLIWSLVGFSGILNLFSRMSSTQQQSRLAPKDK